MTKAQSTEPIKYCALCMLKGVRTHSIEWDGIPICREHVAAAVEENSATVMLRVPAAFGPLSTQLLQ